MEERDEKHIHFMTHFFDQSVKRKLFSSTERAKDIAIRAIKRGGILIPYEKEDSDYLCIFMSDTGSLVVAPIIEAGNNFICRTVFPADDWHRKIYKKEKLRLNVKKRECD